MQLLYFCTYASYFVSVWYDQLLCHEQSDKLQKKKTDASHVHTILKDEQLLQSLRIISGLRSDYVKFRVLGASFWQRIFFTKLMKAE